MPPSGLRFPKGRSPRWKFLPKKLVAHFINIEIASPPLQVTTSISATVVVTNALILTMPMPVLQMTGQAQPYDFDDLSEIHGSLSLQLNPPSLLMTGFIEARGSLLLSMPLPTLIMTGDQFFAARYIKGLVMNMSHFAVTDYIGYDFNSMAYFNRKFLGGNNQGIFSFGGNKDNGLNINARAKMPILDSFQDVIKKARDAWLTCRTDGQMMLVVHFEEGDPYEDIFEETGRALELRGKLPKGIKERFMAFEIRNVDGSDFDNNNLRFTTDTIRRKIR